MNTRVIALIAVLCAAQGAMAQRVNLSISTLDVPHSSGVHDGPSKDDPGAPPFRVFTFTVDGVLGSPVTRLRISDYNLGERSFVRLIPLEDQDQGAQILNAKTIPVWQNATAIFNGTLVLVELHVARGEEGIYINFDQAVGVVDLSGEIPVGDTGSGFQPQTLCGADNRADSNDNRVGRLYFGGCTAWFITNGAFLTAGHCVDTESDGSGNPAPDGDVNLNGVVEFNVPLSTNNGATVAANVDDQFPIQVGTVAFMFDAVGSIGEDWGVFTVGPNGLDQMPWQRYGTIGFRPSRESPVAGNNMTVTGCGLDNTPAGTGGAGAPCCTRDAFNNCTFSCNNRNFTQQTHTGPYVAENFINANRVIITYQVDTTGGNSGSPVIWLTPSPDVAIGIHTNAGCNSDGTGANQGCAFENDALEAAMVDITSTATPVFMDVGHPLPNGVAANGTIMRPFPNLAAAAAAIGSGNIMSIVAGNYPPAGNITTLGEDGKSMTLDAPVGTVVIGN